MKYLLTVYLNNGSCWAIDGQFWKDGIDSAIKSYNAYINDEDMEYKARLEDVAYPKGHPCRIFKTNI